MSPDSLSVIVRAGNYLSLLQAAGTVLFLLQFGRALDASRRGVRTLGFENAGAVFARYRRIRRRDRERILAAAG